MGKTDIQQTRPNTTDNSGELATTSGTSLSRENHAKDGTSLTKMEFTSTEARKYAEQGRLAEWVDLFLTTVDHGKNIELAEILKQYSFVWKGPVKFNLSKLRRIAGPEEGMKYKQEQKWWDDGIATLVSLIEGGLDIPPLIVQVREDGLMLSDGAHRHEALTQLGKNQHWAIIVSDSQELLDELEL